MSRYIDAEWLKAFFEADKGKDRMTPIDSLLALINDAPTIDIVRCGECKHWRAYETWSVCELWTGDPYEAADTNADDFCSDGEREGE